MTLVWIAAVVAAAWLVFVFGLLVTYRELWRRIRREPVLRRPVLIVESDDWGAGPPRQAAALDELAAVLARHRDAAGRPPVLCIALVLAVPDGPATALSDRYHRLELDDERFADILRALRAGTDAGVFALQLHGHEHFWPPALTGSHDPQVRAWLHGSDVATTEALPPHLQSRWVDAAKLPSSTLDARLIGQAVAAEVGAFTRIVGHAPAVVVPPTFVWTREVEAAWSAHGLTCVVTPGWRYTRRDAAGAAAGDEGPIANGDQAGAITYVARCDYFEPLRGRDAVHGLAALQRATLQARPCLLENHRDNFIGDAAGCRRSLQEMDTLLRDALLAHPDLRFMSTHELARVLRERDPLWVRSGVGECLPYWWQRLRASGRAWRLMRLSGLAFVGDAAFGAARG